MVGPISRQTPSLRQPVLRRIEVAQSGRPFARATAAEPPLSLEVWWRVASYLPTMDTRALMRSRPGYFGTGPLRHLLNKQQCSEAERAVPSLYLLELAQAERATAQEKFFKLSVMTYLILHSSGVSFFSLLLSGRLVTIGAFAAFSPFYLVIGSMVAPSLNTKIMLLRAICGTFAALCGASFFLDAPWEEEAAPGTDHTNRRLADAAYYAYGLLGPVACSYLAAYISSRRIRRYDRGQSQYMPIAEREHFVALGEAIVSTSKTPRTERAYIGQRQVREGLVFAGRPSVFRPLTGERPLATHADSARPASQLQWPVSQWGNRKVSKLREFASTGRRRCVELITEQNTSVAMPHLLDFLARNCLQVDAEFTLELFSLGDAFATGSVALPPRLYRQAVEWETLWLSTHRPEIVAEELVEDIKKQSLCYPRAHSLFRAIRQGNEQHGARTVVPHTANDHEKIRAYNEALSVPAATAPPQQEVSLAASVDLASEGTSRRPRHAAWDQHVGERL